MNISTLTKNQKGINAEAETKKEKAADRRVYARDYYKKNSKEINAKHKDWLQKKRLKDKATGSMAI